MGIDTWESRTRDLDEKKKGLGNKELLDGVFQNHILWWKVR